EQIGKGRCPCGDQTTEHSSPVMRQRNEETAHFPARHTCRVGSADERSDRGAGDRHRFFANLVERLKNRDMRQSTRPTASKCKRKAFAHAVRQALMTACRTSMIIGIDGRSTVPTLSGLTFCVIPGRREAKRSGATSAESITTIESMDSGLPRFARSPE